MFGETVTRQRAMAAVNVYSGESEGVDWSDPDELVIECVAVAPGASVELVDVGRSPVEVDLTLYLPYGADLLELDRVVVRGSTYSVEGARADWLNPYTGSLRGSVVGARKVSG